MCDGQITLGEQAHLACALAALKVLDVPLLSQIMHVANNSADEHSAKVQLLQVSLRLSWFASLYHQSGFDVFVDQK